MLKVVFNFFLFFILLVYTILSLIFIQSTPITSDEMDHSSYGLSILKLQPERYIIGQEDSRSSTMPVTALNALPRAIQQLLNPNLKKNDYGIADAIAGRYISLIVFLSFLLLLCNLLLKIMKRPAVLILISVLAFDPNTIKFCNYNSTDVYFYISFILSLLSLYFFIKLKNFKNLFFWSVCTGISLCCKLQNIFLIPLELLILIVAFRGKLLYLLTKRRTYIYAFLFFIIVLLIINVLYLFYKSGSCLNEYPFKSPTFINLQHRFYSDLKLPVPTPFLGAFDLVSSSINHFNLEPANCLNGECRKGRPFYSLYLLLIVFCQTIPALILYILFFIRLTMKNDFLEKLLVMVPFVFFVFFYSVTIIQPGIRYMLPVNALVAIFSVYLNHNLIEKYSRQILLSSAIYFTLMFVGHPNMNGGYYNALDYYKNFHYEQK